jgi:hypothetical protein
VPGEQVNEPLLLRGLRPVGTDHGLLALTSLCAVARAVAASPCLGRSIISHVPNN